MLQLEDVPVDVTLNLLNREVDAQLLKAVRPEVLESKHIQDADGQTLKTQQENRTTHQQHTKRQHTSNMVRFFFSIVFFDKLPFQDCI